MNIPGKQGPNTGRKSKYKNKYRQNYRAKSKNTALELMNERRAFMAGV